MGDYDDIINLPHHISTKYPPMSMNDRAAQFSPFAALTGHNDAIRETARLTKEKPELSEDEKQELNLRLGYIRDNIEQKPFVKITYFKNDNLKSGGDYVTVYDRVVKIDNYSQCIVFCNGTSVPITDIASINGEFLAQFDNIV